MSRAIYERIWEKHYQKILTEMEGKLDTEKGQTESRQFLNCILNKGN